jgi:lipopolysaccharide export system permease protein
MSILTRYICRRLILYYLSIVLVMVAFFVFVDFMENIQRVTKHQAPLRLIAIYYASYLPRIFIESSWIGFLVAMLLVLGGLAKNNEFTAMLAGGISIYRIGAPVLAIGAALTVGVFCVQEFIVPGTMLLAYELKDSKFTSEPAARPIHHIAGIGRRNQLYFFDTLDVEGGVLSGIQISTRKGGYIITRIDAEKAVWDESSGRWTLKDGIVREFNFDGAVVKSAEFSDMKAPFKESPATLKAYSSTRGAFNFLQLRDRIKNLERSGYDARRLKLDYQKKLALPFANLVVVLLGLPFALECRRGGLIIGFALSLAAAVSYYGTFQIGLALGRGGLFPTSVAAWLANILFLAVGAGLTFRTRT